MRRDLALWRHSLCNPHDQPEQTIGSGYEALDSLSGHKVDALNQFAGRYTRRAKRKVEQVVVESSDDLRLKHPRDPRTDWILVLFAHASYPSAAVASVFGDLLARDAGSYFAAISAMKLRWSSFVPSNHSQKTPSGSRVSTVIARPLEHDHLTTLKI